MKYWARIMITMITMALVSCVPTTETENSSVEEPFNPSNATIPESEIEESDSDVEAETETLMEQEEIQTESTETSPQEGEEPQEMPATTEEIPEMPSNNQNEINLNELPHVGKAKADLVARLNIAEKDIEVAKVELVTWPNSAMGCPQPDMMYTQVMQEGLRIQLIVDNITYNYHSGGTRDPFLCQSVTPPVKATQPGLNIEDFITPPATDFDE